ncbi:MAG: DUF1295 domain-containing protein [Clostridia bacterium]|nr:DUF1295 domain-containing protein [Clostridia bacterium]
MGNSDVIQVKKSRFSDSKLGGLVLFSAFYLAAFIAGWAAQKYLLPELVIPAADSLPVGMAERIKALFAADRLLLHLFVFDIVATVVIYIFSCIIHNASLYDAYWSLTPFVMLLPVVIGRYDRLSVFAIVFFAVFSVWSWRLTGNWIVTFGGTDWIDWRYRMYHDRFPALYPVINFFGIQMMPTLLVFAGMIPAIIALDGGKMTALSLIGDAVLLAGVSLEFFADRDVHAFLEENRGRMTVCDRGLWGHSRHPNYLGEITVWFGVYIACTASNPSNFFAFPGCLLMIFLFEVISIPMMEKRQLSRRPDYAGYRKRVSRLILLPERK